MVQNQAENSFPQNSLINFPSTVSRDYSVISLVLNNIFCSNKLSIQRVYLAVARFDLRQQKVVPKFYQSLLEKLELCCCNARGSIKKLRETVKLHAS